VINKNLVWDIVGKNVFQRPAAKKATNYFKVNVVAKVDYDGNPC
jgi:hypothetical protein